jgi:uncharacterized protein YrrD
MFQHCDRLKGFRLGATDGEIGKVEDFYFDDQHWTVRYLVADTGYWLPDRQVLISPHALTGVDDGQKLVHVNLTKQQIEDSPPITSDQPVSRQYEREYYRYYGWPVYWTGPSLWGPGPLPLYYPPLQNAPAQEGSALAEPGDPHLRSTAEVKGYHLQARDGAVGHVEDFIVDDGNWAIRYLVVDTGHWLASRRVLVALQWIEKVSWEQSAVAVDLPKSSIEHAPLYDAETGVTRAYEISLFKHYSREGYWEESAGAGTQKNAA